jgi:glycosyltransferase involved in cell wall biosynthesis
MKPLFVVQGPVATRSGYGEHARDLVRALVSIDKWDIKVVNTRWGSTPMNALDIEDPNDIIIIDRIVTEQLNRQPDIFMQVSVPNEFTPIGKYNIGVTAGIETNICASSWIEGLNKMDMAIVPSVHSKKVFEATKYEKIDEKTKQNVGELKCLAPIEVLFEGADTSIYKKTTEISKSIKDELNKIPEKFIFLFVGHWLKGKLGQDRKDVGGLIKTFCDTFKNKAKAPALLLKTSGATFSVLDREEILKKINEVKATVVGARSLPNIYLLHGDLLPEEMNSLYNHPRIKAHVSFTKGEGFGRPLLEASLSGKPVITSNWSGQKDFLNKNLSVLLPGAPTRVDESAVWEGVIEKDSSWFTVNYQYASSVIENVYKNYKRDYLPKAKKQLLISKSKFSFKAMEEKLDKIIEDYLPEFPKHIELDLGLPKLKKAKRDG